MPESTIAEDRCDVHRGVGVGLFQGGAGNEGVARYRAERVLDRCGGDGAVLPQLLNEVLAKASAVSLLVVSLGVVSTTPCRGVPEQPSNHPAFPMVSEVRIKSAGDSRWTTVSVLLAGRQLPISLP